jgi:hypothetical protein
MNTSERSGQIQELKDELTSASETAEKLFAEQSEDTLMRRPSAGAWSAAECLEHLTATSKSFLPDLAQAKEKAVRESIHSAAPYKMDIVGKFVARMIEPPARFKFPAPPAFLPSTPISAKASLQGFLKSQEAVLHELDSAGAISMVSVKVTSPANPAVKYNLYSAFRILAAHQRRHLVQAHKAVPAR